MFRFTIRDLLWLTVVVALGVGWCLDHRRADMMSAKAKLLHTSMEGLLTMYRDKFVGPGREMSLTLDDGTTIVARDEPVLTNPSAPSPKTPSD